MTVPKDLNPAEALISRFVSENRLPPGSRSTFVLRFKDLLGVVSPEVGWDLMEKDLNDTSEDGLAWLKSKDRIVVPYELADAAFGSAPTMKARGALQAAVRQDVYDLSLKAWGASASNLRPGVPPTTDDDNKIAMEKPKKETGDGKAGPFSENYKGTDTERAQEIGGLIRSLGTKAVSAMAAGSKRDLAGRPLRKLA